MDIIIKEQIEAIDKLIPVLKRYNELKDRSKYFNKPSCIIEFTIQDLEEIRRDFAEFLIDSSY